MRVQTHVGSNNRMPNRLARIPVLAAVVATCVVAASCGAAAPQEFKDCAECPAMVVVPPGKFMMGTADTEKGHEKDESPIHEVTIPQALAVGKFEITFAEWDACVAD